MKNYWHQFDYNRDNEEKEFTVAVLDPSSHNAVFGSFDRLDKNK